MELNATIPCEAQRKKCQSMCCGITGIPQEQWPTLAPQAAVTPEKITRARDKDGVTWVFPITEDLLCCFLDRTTRQCIIYDSRPKVCKDYGYIEALPCPWFSADCKPRNRNQRRSMERKASKKIERHAKMMRKFS